MDEMVAFVRAALDHDEQVALATMYAMSDPGEWKRGPIFDGDSTTIRDHNDSLIHDGGTFRPPDAEHIARWDPARVLAEVQAKRRILQDLVDAKARKLFYERDGEEPFASESAAYVDALHKVIRLLAQPYAGQDGWRQEWDA